MPGLLDYCRREAFHLFQLRTALQKKQVDACQIEGVRGMGMREK